MKTYKYKSYSEYTRAQIAGYEKKKDRVWAIEENIKFIVHHLNKETMNAGLCHGVRGGIEVEWFKKHKAAKIMLGTEIGQAHPPFTVQHDFNKQHKPWIHAFDFIYSNSFDHAYDLKATLNVWAEQLKPGGLIILEMDKRQEHTGEISKPANPTDPVSITLKELVRSIPQWIDGAKVIDVLNMPVVTKEWRKAIIIEVK